MEEIGVFILSTEYVENEQTKNEINAVYKSREGAEKMGEWLLKQKPYNGRKYISYNIDNFMVL